MLEGWKWRRKGGEAEGVHSWAPPGKLAARVKRWRCRRVTHNTSSPTTSLSQSVSTSTCFRVSGCQAAGWEARQVSAVVVGWWPLLLISGLPVSASSSWGQPCPRQPAPVSGSQPGRSRNPQPGGVWKAQQRRQLPLQGGGDGGGGGLDRV